MKKGINYWSFPGGPEGALDPERAILEAQAYRFEALELCIGEAGESVGLDLSDATAEHLCAVAQEHDMAMESVASALYWKRSVGDVDANQRKQAKDDLKRMIEISAALCVRTLLVVPGAVDLYVDDPQRPSQPYADVYRHATDGIAELIPHAKAHGVVMAIENVWNRFLLSPLEMRDFVDQFQSEWVQAYVDVANMLPYGHPEQWLRTLGSRVAGVHFKDYRRSAGGLDGFVDLLEGDVNWPEVMAALQEIGYDGPVVAEMVPHYRFHPEVRVENTSRAMDAILAR